MRIIFYVTSLIHVIHRQFHAAKTSHSKKIENKPSTHTRTNKQFMYVNGVRECVCVCHDVVFEKTKASY